MNKKIKTLIIYETGMHYMIIINEKKQPPYEQNYIQSLKTTYNQYLQESKLQPKVKVVVYESEADNSAKKSSPVQTQETVYELSRSRKNGVSFKEKAKKTTTKNKTNRKEQTKKSRTLGLEAIGKLCRHRRMIYQSS